jgi:hypothetical protein
MAGRGPSGGGIATISRPAAGGRPALGMNRAAIGGGIETGRGGGQGAASFSMEAARKASPFNLAPKNADSLNKAGVNAEKMTVMRGLPQIKSLTERSLAERSVSSNRGSDRFFTAHQREITQRRPTAPPERSTTPDVTNRQLEGLLGRQIRDFDPVRAIRPRGQDIIMPSTGRSSLPRESTPANPTNIKGQEAVLMRKILEAHARGPELRPKAEFRPPGPVTPTPELRPQSPDIARVMVQLNRIAEQTKAKAAMQTEKVQVGSIGKPVESPVSLLKKRDDAKNGRLATNSGTGGRISFDALLRGVKQKPKDEKDEEEKTKTVEQLPARVVRLTPTDARPSGQPSPAEVDRRTVGGGLPAARPAVEVNTSPAEQRQQIAAGPEILTVRQPVSTFSERPRTRAWQRQPLLQATPQETSQNNLANGQKAEGEPPPKPQEDPQREKRPAAFKVALDRLEVRIGQTRDSLEKFASRRGWNTLVSGANLTAESTSATISPIVKKDDPGDHDRIKSIRNLFGTARELFSRIYDINNQEFHLPVAKGRGRGVSYAQVRRVAQGEEKDKAMAT